MRNKDLEVVHPPQPQPKPGPALRYRDTRYTSRVLQLPDGRLLSVAQGIVATMADDTVGLEYLASHQDLVPEE
ncbi:hypothetical protein [Pseudomonas huaxiensis]|uniref:hypothetical protein n=1 Tax=Pseudomonas huaxiensis TaxID=2213017 RepID=UPI0015B08E67|nr:hypothetical protein [Pseudomonas huaxiensis]